MTLVYGVRVLDMRLAIIHTANLHLDMHKTFVYLYLWLETLSCIVFERVGVCVCSCQYGGIEVLRYNISLPTTAIQCKSCILCGLRFRFICDYACLCFITFFVALFVYIKVSDTHFAHSVWQNRIGIKFEIRTCWALK